MLIVDVDAWITRLKTVDWAKCLTVDRVGLTLVGVLGVDERRLAERTNAAVRNFLLTEDHQHQLFIPLDGDKSTGEVLVFEVAQGPILSPDHIHGRSPDVDYGERYWTLDGEIEDVTDGGLPFKHHAGDNPVTHGPDTRHQPRIPRWWVGVFYHPAGSRLVEEVKP